MQMMRTLSRNLLNEIRTSDTLPALFPYFIPLKTTGVNLLQVLIIFCYGIWCEVCFVLLCLSVFSWTYSESQEICINISGEVQHKRLRWIEYLNQAARQGLKFDTYIYWWYHLLKFPADTVDKRPYDQKSDFSCFAVLVFITYPATEANVNLHKRISVSHQRSNLKR